MGMEWIYSCIWLEQREPRLEGMHECRTVERVTWAHASSRRIVSLLTIGTTIKKTRSNGKQQQRWLRCPEAHYELELGTWGNHEGATHYMRAPETRDKRRWLRLPMLTTIGKKFEHEYSEVLLHEWGQGPNGPSWRSAMICWSHQKDENGTGRQQWGDIKEKKQSSMR